MQTLTRAMVYATLQIVALLATGVASAAPVGQLSFRDPTGAVGPADTIDVWLTFTLNPGSPALVLDSSLPGFGVDPVDVPDDWYDLTGAMLSVSIGCSGSFVGPSCAGPYTFLFNTTGPDSLVDATDIDLLPGDSVDYLLGRFVPTGGTVAPGTYLFTEAYLALVLTGRIPTAMQPLLDEYGEPVYDDSGPVYVPLSEVSTPTEFYGAVTGYGLGATSLTGSTFERTVVPLPASWPLLLTALAALGGIRRRR